MYQESLFTNEVLEKSTLYARVSHANHFRQPANKAASRTSVFCGRSYSELSQMLSQNILSLKTSPDYSLSTTDSSSPAFSTTWGKSGMMSSGKCYRLPVLERGTDGKECGLLPTPRATDDRGATKAQSAIDTIDRNKAGLNLSEFVQLFPTPTASDWHGVVRGFVSGMKRKSGATVGYSLAYFPHFQNLLTRKTMYLNPQFSLMLMGFPDGWLTLS